MKYGNLSAKSFGVYRLSKLINQRKLNTSTRGGRRLRKYSQWRDKQTEGQLTHAGKNERSCNRDTTTRYTKILNKKLGKSADTAKRYRVIEVGTITNTTMIRNTERKKRAKNGKTVHTTPVCFVLSLFFRDSFSGKYHVSYVSCVIRAVIITCVTINPDRYWKTDWQRDKQAERDRHVEKRSWNPLVELVFVK